MFPWSLLDKYILGDLSLIQNTRHVTIISVFMEGSYYTAEGDYRKLECSLSTFQINSVGLFPVNSSLSEKEKVDTRFNI